LQLRLKIPTSQLSLVVAVLLSARLNTKYIAYEMYTKQMHQTLKILWLHFLVALHFHFLNRAKAGFCQIVINA